MAKVGGPLSLLYILVGKTIPVQVASRAYLMYGGCLGTLISTINFTFDSGSIILHFCMGLPHVSIAVIDKTWVVACERHK